MLRFVYPLIHTACLIFFLFVMRRQVMIVRASSGLKVTELFGNFYRRRPQGKALLSVSVAVPSLVYVIEMDLPVVDSDKTVSWRAILLNLYYLYLCF